MRLAFVDWNVVSGVCLELVKIMRPTLSVVSTGTVRTQRKRTACAFSDRTQGSTPSPDGTNWRERMVDQCGEQ
jgi:hypothetical protein